MDIYKNIEEGKYIIKDKHPALVQKVCINGHRVGFVVPNFCPECGVETKSYINERIIERKKKVSEYREKEKNLLNLFKRDLFEYFDITGNSKAESFYHIVWEDAHSEGIAAVVDRAFDLVVLIE